MNQYKGIPTRDSTRESKMQMQECTTRRLCQQTEIMLGSEGCVMMLSMNLSTLCLCKAVCQVRTHIWNRRIRQGAAGRPGIYSVIDVLVLDSSCINKPKAANACHVAGDLRYFISFSIISLQAFGIDAELAIAQLMISIERHASLSSLVKLISGHLV